MDKGALVSEQVDGGLRFLAEFQKYVPVLAAFWLKEADEAFWYLYVASEQITDDNFDVLYRDVIGAADALEDIWFDPSQVKLIGADDRLAKAALEVRRVYPKRRGPIRQHDTLFDGVSAEEVYLYPSPLPSPPR